ncbi:MBL fold metallo-hydrolase [Syntrophomonas erecta]
MMQLTVVGCWSPFPKMGEACSGYLIQSQTTRLLLDCGHSVFSELQRYTNINDLDAVFISHFHPDHSVDLYAIRHAIRGLRFLGKRKQPLKIFIPSTPEHDYQYWRGVNEVEVITIEHGLQTKVGDLELQFCRAKHPLETYGVRIDEAGKSLFYSADTALNDEMIRISHGCRLLLAETTLLKTDSEYAAQTGHLTTAQTGNWAEMAQVGRLVATHIWPDYQLEQIEQEIRTTYQGKLDIAGSGLTISF